MNFPLRQAPICPFNLSCKESPFIFLVEVYVAVRVTPNISRWFDKEKKLHGKSSWVSTPLHLPNARNLHFPAAGSLCSLQPLLFSNKDMAFSTRINSAMDVIAGFTSSHFRGLALGEGVHGGLHVVFDLETPH